MKITKSQLEQIISEEISTLSEEENLDEVFGYLKKKIGQFFGGGRGPKASPSPSDTKKMAGFSLSKESVADLMNAGAKNGDPKELYKALDQVFKSLEEAGVEAKLLRPVRKVAFEELIKFNAISGEKKRTPTQKLSPEEIAQGIPGEDPNKAKDQTRDELMKDYKKRLDALKEGKKGESVIRTSKLLKEGIEDLRKQITNLVDKVKSGEMEFKLALQTYATALTMFINSTLLPNTKKPGKVAEPEAAPAGEKPAAGEPSGEAGEAEAGEPAAAKEPAAVGEKAPSEPAAASGPVKLFKGGSKGQPALYNVIYSTLKNKDPEASKKVTKSGMQTLVKGILKNLSAQLRFNKLKVQESLIFGELLEQEEKPSKNWSPGGDRVDPKKGVIDVSFVGKMLKEKGFSQEAISFVFVKTVLPFLKKALAGTDIKINKKSPKGKPKTKGTPGVLTPEEAQAIVDQTARNSRGLNSKVPDKIEKKTKEAGEEGIESIKNDEKRGKLKFADTPPEEVVKRQSKRTKTKNLSKNREKFAKNVQKKGKDAIERLKRDGKLDEAFVDRGERLYEALMKKFIK